MLKGRMPTRHLKPRASAENLMNLSGMHQFHALRHAHWWRSRKALIFLTLTIVLVGLGLLGLKTKSMVAQVSIESSLGRTELLAGADSLRSGGAGVTSAQAQVAARHFGAATAHFERAHGLLTTSRLVHALRGLPWLGTQVSAATSLSDIGTHASKAGSLISDTLATALKAQPSGTAGSDPGKKIIELLDALDPKLDQLTAELERVRADRSRIPSTGLIPQLSSAVTQIDRKVDLAALQNGLTDLRREEPGVRQILAATDSRSYLVLEQDPAELRATGGFIGSVGFLRFNHGSMGEFAPEDIDHFDRPGGPELLGPPGTPSHVDAPYPLQYVFHLQSWAMRDSNWSPDFPTAARQVEFFLDREAKRHVDGVIAIDPYLIASLLEITGPITVPETGDTVDSKNFYSLTLHRLELNTSVNRKDFLGQASRQILPKLLSLPVDQWFKVFQVLQTGCDRRSLQVYFHDAVAQSVVARHQCGGEVRSQQGDYLMINESNVGGNKDDFWLKRQYSLQLVVQPDGAVHHVLHLHYDGLTDHGFLLTGRWGYTGWLRVYLPSTASFKSSSGADLRATKDLGKSVLEGWFYVQFNSSRDITINYDLPALPGGTSRLDLTWQKQPGRFADPVSVEVGLPSGWKMLSRKVGTTAAADGPIRTDLMTDRTFEIQYRTR
jgi:hypothetical protein